jgi:WD40 repeat protein
LLIGGVIAGLAVAYQEKPGRIEGRGASVVSSQAVDLIKPTRWAAHRGAVTGLSHTDQGRAIVSAGADATVKIWNGGSGLLIRSIDLDDGPATALAVDEHRALTGHSNGLIALWDLERAEKIKTFQYHDTPITSLAFTRDTNVFAVGSGAGVAMFDVRAPSAPTLLIEGPEVGAAQLIASARWRTLLVAGGQDRSIRLWRTETGSLARTYRDPSGMISALDIASGGQLVASAGMDGSVRLWSASSSRLQRSFRTHQGRITSLAIAPNDRLVASAGMDGQIKLWDLTAGRRTRTLQGHSGAVRAITFSPDGRRLVSAGEDGQICIWNVLSHALGIPSRTP